MSDNIQDANLPEHQKVELVPSLSGERVTCPHCGWMTTTILWIRTQCEETREEYYQMHPYTIPEFCPMCGKSNRGIKP